VQERIQRLEGAQSPLPDIEVKTVPVVPDAPPPPGSR